MKLFLFLALFAAFLVYVILFSTPRQPSEYTDHSEMTTYPTE